MSIKILILLITLGKNFWEHSTKAFESFVDVVEPHITMPPKFSTISEIKQTFLDKGAEYNGTAGAGIGEE